MGQFDYEGQLESGQSLSGTVTAEDQAAAEKALLDHGVRVFGIRPARSMPTVAPLSIDEFQYLNEQLATLAAARTPLHEGLRSVAADAGSMRLRRALLDLASDLESGAPLDQAIDRMERRFPRAYAPVVRAGLQTGDLSGTLYSLAAHLRLRSVARRAMIELAAYPLMVLLLGFGVLALLMHTLLPAVVAILRDMYVQQGLPQTATGNNSVFWWQVAAAVYGAWLSVEVFLLVGLLALGLLAVTLASRWSAPWREAVLYRIPGYWQVYWSSCLARFAQTTALGAFGSLPLHELLAAGGAASGSRWLEGAARRAAQRLAEGKSLQQATQDESAIPKLWICIVGAAATRGDLAGALADLARTYESRAEHWVQTMRVVVGPLLVVLVGGGIGLALLSLAGAMVGLMRHLMAF